MATTPNLGITELAPSQASKDVTVNTALASLDEAIAGITTLVCTTGSPFTLTASQWINMVLKCTGSPSGAVTINVPAANPKLYVVDNSCGQAVTIQTSGGSGVTVASGSVEVVRCDGTNVVAVVTGSVTSITMGGDVTGSSSSSSVKQAHYNLVEVTDGTTPYTILSTDSIIIGDGSSGAVTATLPSATGSGRLLVFKNISASKTFNIARSGSDTIDGATSAAISTQYGVIALVDQASGVWVITGEVGAAGSSVTMGGDVTGSSGSATVAKVQGTAVSTTGPTANQVMQYISGSSEWVPTSQPYDMPIAISGKPTAGQYVKIVMARSVVIAANLAGWQCTVGTNPTSTAVIDIYQNGTLVANISISTSGTPTLSTQVAFTLSAGDVLEFLCPATQDATMADLSITATGTR